MGLICKNLDCKKTTNFDEMCADCWNEKLEKTESLLKFETEWWEHASPDDWWDLKNNRAIVIMAEI